MFGNIAYGCDWNEEGGCDRRRFFRFAMAIAVPAETTVAITEVLFKERWIAVFDPPVRLLSDRGKVFVLEVMQNLCPR
jgi:hypothetical protein